MTPARYAVIGHPIEHSRSPQIHTAFAAQLGHALTYERLLGDLDDVETEIRAFFAAGGAGLNVTVPFKERAFALAERHSPGAQRAAAVNTLLPDAEGRLVGHNTDGPGLVTDLCSNHGLALQGARVLLLGAGGAARGVLLPLLEQAPVALFVANRTASKARELAALFADAGAIEGGGFDALPAEPFDLIINATAAGLSDQVPPIPGRALRPGGWTYDMMYGAAPTAFVRWGRAHGAGQALDGLGMLVEQAAEAFALWRGVRPQTAPVIAALR